MCAKRAGTNLRAHSRAIHLRGEDWFEAADQAAIPWPKIQATVNTEQERLAALIGEIEAGQVTSPVADAGRFDLVLGITCHAIYHSGQIQLIKRLQEGGQMSTYFPSWIQMGPLRRRCNCQPTRASAPTVTFFLQRPDATACGESPLARHKHVIVGELLFRLKQAAPTTAYGVTERGRPPLSGSRKSNVTLPASIT